MEKVKVYGANWCGDTKRTLKFGERILSVPNDEELEGALGQEGLVK